MNRNRTHSSISAIILAAGTSTRMGEPKQLLKLKERPLLEHAIRTAASVNFSEIITVIGYEASLMQTSIIIDDPRFRWVMNEDYLSGQASSLKVGFSHVEKDAAGVMVFLADLPFISQNTVHSIYQTGIELLNKITESFIVQPKYKGVTGHPAFFGNPNREMFMKLQGDRGAKPLIHTIAHRQILPVDDPGILFDIDTPKAYEEAKKQNL